MGAAIAFVATIPAYLAGGIALMMGAGWLASLGVLMATGIGAALLMAVLIALRATPETQGLAHRALLPE